MEKRAAKLEAEVERWLSAAEAATPRKTEPSAATRAARSCRWVADEEHVEKIRRRRPIGGRGESGRGGQGQAQAEEQRRAEAARPGRPAAPPSEEPDPEREGLRRSRKPHHENQGRLHPAGCAAAVDATAQVIVAHGLDAKQSDQRRSRDGRRHRSRSGRSRRDCRQTRLLLRRQPSAMEEREIDAYVAPGGPSTPGKEKAARPRRRHARKSRPRHFQPLPLRERLPGRCSDGSSGARLPSVSLARRREGRRRVGLVCLAHDILKLAQGETRPWPHSQPLSSPPRKRSDDDRREASTQPYIEPDRDLLIRLSDWLDAIRDRRLPSGVGRSPEGA